VSLWTIINDFNPKSSAAIHPVRIESFEEKIKRRISLFEWNDDFHLPPIIVL
jgi:hypothetical protein